MNTEKMVSEKMASMLNSGQPTNVFWSEKTTTCEVGELLAILMLFIAPLVVVYMNKKVNIVARVKNLINKARAKRINNDAVNKELTDIDSDFDEDVNTGMEQYVNDEIKLQNESNNIEQGKQVTDGEATATTPAIEALLNSCHGKPGAIKDSSKIEMYLSYFSRGLTKTASLCDKADYSPETIKDVARKAKDLLAELEKEANSNISEMYSKYKWLKSETEFLKHYLLNKAPKNQEFTRRVNEKPNTSKPLHCSCVMPDTFKITYNQALECYNFLSRCSDESNVSRDPKHFSFETVTKAIETVSEKSLKKLKELEDLLNKDAKMLHETARWLETEIDRLERTLLKNIRAAQGRNNYSIPDSATLSSPNGSPPMVLYAPEEEKVDLVSLLSNGDEKLQKALDKLKILRQYASN